MCRYIYTPDDEIVHRSWVMAAKEASTWSHISRCLQICQNVYCSRIVKYLECQVKRINYCMLGSISSSLSLHVDIHSVLVAIIISIYVKLLVFIVIVKFSSLYKILMQCFNTSNILFPLASQKRTIL